MRGAIAAAALVALGIAAGGARAQVRLLGVEVERDGSASRVELRADAELPAAAPFRLDAPARLVLDLPGVVNASRTDRIEVGAPDLRRVRIGQHAGFVRIVLDLTAAGAGELRLARETRSLAIALGPRALPPVGAPPPARDRAAPAPAAGGAPPGEAPVPSPSVRIYGVELQSTPTRDRVLVFTEHAPAAELVTIDERSVELRLADAVLDASATRLLKPEVGGAVSQVVVFEPVSLQPEVRIRIERRPGAVPSLSQRGAILAVEFPVEAAPDAGLTLGFVDAELPRVVNEVGEATHTSFVYDERLQGRVTISVPERVSRAEALEILQASLLGMGFAAVRAPGGSFRILPAAEARAVAPAEDAPRAGAAALVTTLLRLRHADAADLVASLQPYAGSSVLAASFGPTNSVILAGSEAQLHRYLALAQALDEAESIGLAVIPLRHRAAEEIAAILAEAWPSTPAQKKRAPPARVEVWHDARSNSVLVRAPTRRLAELESWVRALDRAPSGEGSIRVIRPRNAGVARLAETLGRLAQGDPSAATGEHAAAGLLGRSFHVAAHEPTGALLVEADPETQALVRDLIEEIDRRPPSIRVDLLVLEISTRHGLALGIEALIPFGDVEDPGAKVAGAFAIRSGDVFQNVSDPRVGFFRYARDPLVIPIVGPDGMPAELVVPRESGEIVAAQGDVTTRTLLRPHLVALAGEEHELVAGDNVPVLVGATDPAGAPAASDPLTIQNEIERRDVGMRLRVRPSAGQAGDVRLALEVEASRVRPIPAAIAERVGPVIEQRTLQAVTRLAHGELALLGMALDESVQDREAGVPFLKDIPLLGWLARSTLHERVQRTLVIAVRAGIERSPEARLADSVRQRLAFERALARRGALRIGADDGYALLVTTRANEGEARGVASVLSEAGAPEPRVVAWNWEGQPRYDVYVGGFASLSEASAAAVPLVDEGFDPELVALP